MNPEKIAAAAAAASIQGQERRRQAVTISHTSSGTAQTQWCVQEIGETSRPVKAQHRKPGDPVPAPVRPDRHGQPRQPGQEHRDQPPGTRRVAGAGQSGHRPG